jgi:hypothetical protein
VGSATRSLAKTVTKTLQVFCLKENSIAVALMVTFVTLVEAAPGTEITARMKRMHSNMSQLHLMLLFDVIHKLHYGYNNNVTVVLHNFIFRFRYLLLQSDIRSIICALYAYYFYSLFRIRQISKARRNYFMSFYSVEQ